MIIFLNGASSSGKSTIVKALQYLLSDPWLHLGIDVFFNMIPAKYTLFGENADQGFSFIEKQENSKKYFEIMAGPFGEKFVNSCIKACGLMAKSHNLIIDEVVYDQAILSKYVSELSSETVYFINIYCSLDLIEEREIIRRCNSLPLARGQVDKINKLGINYDLIIDSGKSLPFDCAKKILSFIKTNPKPKAFKEYKKSVLSGI